MDGRTDGRTDARRAGWLSGWLDALMDGLLNGWKKRNGAAADRVLHFWVVKSTRSPMPRARHAAHNLTPEQQTLKYEGVPQLLPRLQLRGLQGGL